MTTTTDRLVQDYLDRLERAAAALPAERRTELLEEIEGHIEDARAAGAAADEAAVRTLLDRLGPPEVIAAAAAEEEPAAPPAPALAPAGTGHELAAVLLLTAGSFVPVAGWLVGVVLLWTSSRWRLGERVLGTLVVPLGPGGVLLAGGLLGLGSGSCTSYAPAPGPGGSVPTDVQTCSSGLPGPLRVALLVVLVVAPFVVAAALYRRARERAASEPPRVVRPVSRDGWGPLEVAAVVLLAVGGFVAPVVGPVAGLVLALVSSRWTRRDKTVAAALSALPLVGLALLPLGGAVAVGVPTSLPSGLELVVLGFLGPVVAAGYLTVVLSRPRRASAG